MITLYQFRHSAFCLKTRMALHAKKLQYRVEEVTPGIGQFEIFKLSGQKQVPVIVDSNDQVINDSSTICEYIDKKNVKLIENSENKGLTKSLNSMIKVAQGKFIARQDADDISLYNRIQVQVDLINKFNLDFVSTRAISLQTKKYIPNISFNLPYKYLIK